MGRTPLGLMLGAILPFGLSLTACTAEVPAQPFAEVEITPVNLEQFARSCALCHGLGFGGAPRPGDDEAWQERIGAGETVLFANTVEGVGGMPPLGMCMDCSARDLEALIRLLTEPGQGG